MRLLWHFDAVGRLSTPMLCLTILFPLSRAALPLSDHVCRAGPGQCTIVTCLPALRLWGSPLFHRPSPQAKVSSSASAWYPASEELRPSLLSQFQRV